MESAPTKFNAATKPYYSHYSLFAMNTSLDLVLCHEDEELCNRVYEAAEKLVADYELILSRYHPDSELYRLNQNACGSWIKTSQLLWKAIKMGFDFYERTQGYFNISLGNLFQQMKDGQQTEPVIQSDLLEKIELDKKTQSIHFTDEKVCIDFGGMGKGIALNEIGKIIDHNNIKNAFVSFGGSSILTRGHHPHGEYWPLSMHSIDDKEWRLNDAAISISGTHLKTPEKSVAHIVNPYIFQTIRNKKTAFVKAANPIVAEVLSTTLIAAPDNLHPKIMAAFHDADYELI